MTGLQGVEQAAGGSMKQITARHQPTLNTDTRTPMLVIVLV